MKQSFIIMGILISIIGLPAARAQSITPSTFNATGGSGSIGLTIIDYSIGEIALVGTVYTDSLVVTQGLLQNDISIPASAPNTILAHNLRVFPNPASSVVNLQYTSPVRGTLSYRLLDMPGQVILKNSLEVNPGLTKQQINVSGLAVATYMLEVTFKTAENKEQVTSYKIQKLQ